MAIYFFILFFQYINKLYNIFSSSPSRIHKNRFFAMVSNEALLVLQAALFAATLVVLLRCRRSPEPPPPPLPLAVPLPETEPVGQKRKGKTKRQAPFGAGG